jgi:hypothetical protein
MMIYYPLWVRFQGRLLGLVWQTDSGDAVDADTDAVLVQDGKVAAAGSAGGLRALGVRHGITLEDDDDDPLELDGLGDLLELPPSDELCARLLNAWNLYGDIARSVGCSLDDRGPVAGNCYDKLFYGCNLESITPAGEHYAPVFSEDEKDMIREVLNRGRIILAGHLQPESVL